MSFLKITGIVLCACLALLWLQSPRFVGSGNGDLVLAAHDKGSLPSDPALDEPTLQGAGRLALSAGRGELRLTRVGRCPPVGRLSIALEDEARGEARELSIRDTLTLRDLPSGNYILRSREPAWHATPKRFFLGPSTRGMDVDFELDPHGQWSGRLVDLQSGAALTRASLHWMVRGELGALPFEGEAGSRSMELADGRFQIGCGGFIARESQLTIEVQGFRPFFTAWIPWDGSCAMELGDIGMVPLGQGPWNLRGTVVEAGTGVPLAAVNLVAVSETTEASTLWLFGESLQGSVPQDAPAAISDSQGRFDLSLDSREPRRVAAFRASHGLFLSDPASQGEIVRIEMPRRAVLRGRVVTTDEVRAQSLLAGVVVSGPNGTAVLRLDHDLNFELGGLTAGRVRVALQALEPQSGGQPVAAEVVVQNVELLEGEVAQVELRYGVDAVTLALRGRVHLPHGIEFPTMRAALVVQGEVEPTQFAVIDPSGAFALPGEPGVRAQIYIGGTSADSSRGFVGTRALDPDGGAALLAEFDVRTPMVAGQAWKAGDLARRFSVVLTPLAPSPQWARAVAEGLSISTDEHGEFEIFGLEPGPYEIGRLGGIRQAFSVSGKEIAPIVLRLE